MKKLWVVAKNFDTYFIRRLQEYAGDDLGLYDPWSGLSAVALQGPVLLRTSSVHAGEADLCRLERDARSATFINPLASHREFWTKPLQYEYFIQHSLGCLPWLDLSSSTWPAVEAFLERYPSRLYLKKPHRGQQGWGIQVFNGEELRLWHEESLDREYLLQPFLEGAREYRYFFIRGHWRICLERKTPSGPAANFACGGNAELVKLPELLLPLTERLSQGLYYGAMDFLVLQEQIFCLDLNLAPGIEQLEAITGVDVMDILIRSILAN